MHAPPESPVTDEQLLLALRQLRHQHWPADPQACLAHPVYGPCIRGLARNLNRRAFGKTGVPVAAQPPARPAAPAPASALQPPAPPASTTRQAARITSKAAPFDARRAAANDRDDD